MSQPAVAGGLHVGFLTVLRDANGYSGGYLVTNLWGRPVEFRLSTAVQPNRIQQILYGTGLRSFVCADLIGKTLIDKAAIGVQFVVTDTEPVLDLRPRLAIPVAYLIPEGTCPVASDRLVADRAGRVSVLCHAAHASDDAAMRDLFLQLGEHLDLAEPFARIREAMAEARKMGMTSRAA